MSTYQPPGGGQQQPEQGPAYVPPQDPWQGSASVPTDPIPYNPYGSGNTGSWAQQTAIVGGPEYAYGPQRSRVGLFILVFLLVLVLGGGGGLATWWVVSNHNAQPTASPSATSSPSGSATAPSALSCPVTPAAGAFDPCTVKKDDCLFNEGTEAKPDIQFAECSAQGTFKVIKVMQGIEIPEAANGKFNRDTTAVTVCDATGYQAWYGYKHGSDPNRDVFLCLTRN